MRFVDLRKVTRTVHAPAEHIVRRRGRFMTDAAELLIRVRHVVLADGTGFYGIRFGCRVRVVLNTLFTGGTRDRNLSGLVLTTLAHGGVDGKRVFGI